MLNLQIYCTEVTPRLRYISAFVFTEILNIDTVEFITTPDFTAPLRICYHTTSEEGAFHIVPFGLLSEKGLRLQPLQSMEFEEECIFFPVGNGDLPFDFLSAAFFLLSRYEEYLPGLRDEHQRFPAAYSTAMHMGFLHRPYIDVWAGKIAQRLSTMFNLSIGYRGRYNAQISIDVDFPFAFKGRSKKALGLRLVKDVVKWRSELARERIKYLKTGQDPYDTFAHIDQRAITKNLPLTYFCQTGNNGKYDHNLLPSNPAYTQLIRHIGEQHNIGLHPSYQSVDRPGLLLEERERLESVLQHKVFAARQHYIRVKTPDYYRHLLEIGITDDYSMGYVQQVGFRASTARSFLFYDLEKENVTSLRLHPFISMDSVFIYHLQTGSDKALQISRLLIEEAKKVEGTAHTVFHNPVLSDCFEWQGWSGYFDQLTEML
jgi:hypothetical protein